MREPAIPSDAVWVHFTTLPMTTQLCVCCKTGCGGVNSCSSVSYSHADNTGPNSAATLAHVRVWVSLCCVTRPEFDSWDNYTVFWRGVKRWRWNWRWVLRVSQRSNQGQTFGAASITFKNLGQLLILGTRCEGKCCELKVHFLALKRKAVLIWQQPRD